MLNSSYTAHHVHHRAAWGPWPPYTLKTTFSRFGDTERPLITLVAGLDVLPRPIPPDTRFNNPICYSKHEM